VAQGASLAYTNALFFNALASRAQGESGITGRRVLLACSAASKLVGVAAIAEDRFFTRHSMADLLDMTPFKVQTSDRGWTSWGSALRSCNGISALCRSETVAGYCTAATTVAFYSASKVAEEKYNYRMLRKASKDVEKPIAVEELAPAPSTASE
jgi:hypothetical protein